MTDSEAPVIAADPDTSQVVEVLLPLALDHPYSYRVPEGAELAAGDYVRVPLGPRQAIGVVWIACLAAGVYIAGAPPLSG